MINKLVEVLLGWSERENSLKNKQMSLILGAIFFIFILPTLLILAGLVVEKYIVIEWPRALEIGIGIVTIPFGLFLLFWCMIVQWKIGKGTPTPTAPTQKLIVVGPYKYVRNPIVVSEVLYYLGLGSVFVNLTVGITCFIISLTGMTIYYRFVEEKELLERFGEEYKIYRDNTPFYIPKIFKK